MDDVVHPLVHNDPHKLLHMVKAMVPIMVDIYAAHGMKLNVSQGKSEAILALRGKGSKALKAKLAETSVISIKTAALGNVDLRIVDRYKHLGGVVTAGSTMLPEVLARSDSSTTAFLPLANKVFSARWLPSQTRTSLAKSLIYSRLLHNACTWPSLPTSAAAKVHATYMKPLRRITGDVRHAGATSSKPDREVIKQLCMPSAACAVMAARFRYAARVAKAGPPVLRSLVTDSLIHEGTWAATVLEHIQTMHSSSARTAELPPPQLDLQPWLSLMKSYPRQWQTMVADLALKVSDLSMPDLPKQDPDQKFLCYACDVFVHVSLSARRAC